MVTDGSSFRVVAGDPRAPPEVAAVAFSEDERSDSAAGSSRALETVQECHRECTGPQTQVEPRCIPRDRPILSNQARESFGGHGRRARPCRGGAQGRIDEGQGRIEATCGGGGHRPVSVVHRQERRIREWTQRAEECVLTEAPERPERLLEAQSRTPTTMPFQDPAPQVTSLQQMVNTLQAERDALAQELHSARQVGSIVIS